jgi:hypothetical protein
MTIRSLKQGGAVVRGIQQLRRWAIATQKVEREMLIQAIEQYPDLDNEVLPITAGTLLEPKERKVNFFSRVANAFWKMSCGLSFVGFFLPLELDLQHSRSLSPKEKAEIEGYLRGF